MEELDIEYIKNLFIALNKAKDVFREDITLGDAIKCISNELEVRNFEQLMKELKEKNII